MAENNNETKRKDHPFGQVDQPCQNDHAQPQCPYRDKEKHREGNIEVPAEIGYDHF